MTRHAHRCAILTVLLTCCGLAMAALGEDDLSLREEQAMKAAVAQVAPSVVRIETVGGQEKVGQLLVGTGPTTGLVVTADGYILSSAFNFVQQPTSILVTLPDGTRAAARRVATDHSRLLVLLKVNVEKPLAPAQPAPESQVRPGQWAIAMGRTYDGDSPNISVGIVSAVKRIWGKAIQTDAKISPSNYGGPLIDLRGRVLGILTPMSPQGADAVAGVEWYDSGIGFAVPLESMLKVLPRLEAGEDLRPGILGINLRGADQFVDPAVVAAARPNSPAYAAGLKADDRIVEFDGQPVVRQAQLKQLIGPRYAGDKIRLTLLRGEERIERELELIAKLEPYIHPFLGLLPRREGTADGGIAVRYVYPDGPAAKAGVEPGDVLVSVQGQPVAGYGPLLERLAPLAAEDKAKFSFRRGGDTREVELTLTAFPESAPAELPPARGSRPPFAGERSAVGRSTLKLPESSQESLVYVPEGYDPAVPQGVLVWLNGGAADSAEQLDALVQRWKPYCDSADLILVAPRSLDGAKWEPAKDSAHIRKQLDQLRASYMIDPARIVAAGQGAGGSLAYVLAMEHRDLFRGVAAVEAAPAGQIAENEPIYRLAFWTTRAEKAPLAKATDAGVKRLRELKYPVTVLELGDEQRDLTPEEQAGLVRWIDALDRF